MAEARRNPDARSGRMADVRGPGCGGHRHAGNPEPSSPEPHANMTGDRCDAPLASPPQPRRGPLAARPRPDVRALCRAPGAKSPSAHRFGTARKTVSIIGDFTLIGQGCKPASGRRLGAPWRPHCRTPWSTTLKTHHWSLPMKPSAGPVPRPSRFRWSGRRGWPSPFATNPRFRRHHRGTNRRMPPTISMSVRPRPPNAWGSRPFLDGRRSRLDGLPAVQPPSTPAPRSILPSVVLPPALRAHRATSRMQG